MAENPVRVVLDTNILFSAIAYGGKPEQVFVSVLNETIDAVTSPVLLSELQEVLSKKLSLPEEKIKVILAEIEEIFEIIQPKKTINTLKDEDDNRVLEAAVEGKCSYIVTGDKELLNLGSFKGIRILTADQFLSTLDIVSYSKPRLPRNS